MARNRLPQLVATVLVLCTLCLASCGPHAPQNTTDTPQSIPAVNELRSLDHSGIERTYFLHVPSGLYEGEPVPLVLVFHGGGGNGTSLVGFSGFDKVADREEFIAVFPDGVGGNWNDGRENFASESHQLNVDDVGFTDALIETIAGEFPVDRKRIYATGISNGGIFCHFLAGQRSGTLAAIAPVAGGIAVPFNEQFNPDEAVSVLIIQGTEDRLVPYAGGEVAGGNRGEVVSTDETVRLWVEHDGCGATEGRRRGSYLARGAAVRVQPHHRPRLPRPRRHGDYLGLLCPASEAVGRARSRRRLREFGAV
ncbi:MAG: hypothetical protein NTU41_10465 [Chloroflexi bacterium]|nr:hypothetical protein [Chloroflexota bacterium]